MHTDTRPIPFPGSRQLTALRSNEVRETVVDVLLRAALLATIAGALDLGASWLPVVSQLGFLSVDVNRDAGADGYGAQAIRFLATYFGLLPALVVAISSLAVTTLNPFGNPAFLLLYRWYESRSFERILKWLHGRTNRFHRALVFALGLQASLLLLASMRELGLSRNHLPAILWVGFLILVLVVSVLSLVVWVISLRRSSNVIRETLFLAHDTLDHLKRGHLLRGRWAGVRSPYRTVFVEQEDAKRCVYALTELALRAIETRQRFVAREAVAGLGELSEWLRKNARGVSGDWSILLSEEGNDEVVREDWFLELLAESEESIALASTELHYLSVAQDALREARAISTVLIGHHESGDISQSLDRSLRVFENVADECIQFKDPNILDAVSQHLASVLKEMTSSATLQNSFQPVARRILYGASLRAVTPGDVAGLRALMEAARAGCTETAAGRQVLLDTHLDLGATALASRCYAPASDLIDRFASAFLDFRADWSALLTRRAGAQSNAVPTLPNYVKDHYFMLFVLLATARARQLFGADIQEICRLAWPYVAALDNAERRADYISHRVGRTVAFPDREITGWMDAVREICAAQPRQA